jgi:hypothetical protein
MVSSFKGRGALAGLALIALLVAGAAACQGILGISDRVLDPDLTDGGGIEASTGDVVVDTNVADSGAGDSSVKDSGMAGETSVDGGCGDLQTSGTNCGRCGHDCLGGACDAGVCQPVALTTSNGTNRQPTDIAVDDASVYWAEPYSNGTVYKADKNGNNAIVMFDQTAASGHVTFPFHLTVDSNSIYVADYGGYVLSCAISGCGGNPNTLGTLNAGNSNPIYLALGGAYVYASDNDGNVWRMPRDGGASPSSVAMYSPVLPDSGGSQSVPFELAVDTTAVYFTNGDGTVQKAPLDGGALQQLGAGPVQTAGGIALGNGVVYFTQNVDPGGTVNSLTTAGGGTLNVIQGGQHQPFSIAADANNLYWVTEGSNPDLHDGTVMMCPLTNCTNPIKLAGAQLDPVGIAVDSTAVYWVNNAFSAQPNESGGVYRVAKP